MLCDKCQGDLHNQPIVGLRIMWGMRSHNNGQWRGGSILDPRTGHIYECLMILKDNGQVLDVHGYFAIPLVGRTQTWHRLAETAQ